jgi:hypothetical protein
MPDRQLQRVRRPHSHSRPLPQRALEDLHYIRETMERSSAFTATPGWGQVWMGLTAIGAAGLASRQSTAAAWLAVWLLEAVVAVSTALVAMQLKARRSGLPLTSGPGRQFALSFLPPVGVAVLLTAALYHAGYTRLLPGVWLLLYGVGVGAGGAFSISLLRAMGRCFFVTGAIALFVPAYGTLLLAAGFGGLHMLFGAWIARKHGG